MLAPRPIPICLSVILLAATPTIGQDSKSPDRKATPKPQTDESRDQEASRPRVRLQTSMGEIVVELRPDKAPRSVENFLGLAKKGFYHALVFHRVKPEFMIQGGGYDKDLKKRTDGLPKPIRNESDNGLSNLRGTIAMARLDDPHSATSQFFINVVNNKRLDYDKSRGFGYTVFGKVVEGMDVVDKIRYAKCTTHPNDPGRGKEGAVNPDPPAVIKRISIGS
jgi:cyclophilin family peptidyl-prolyl cis-trans isomerase